MDKEPSNFDQAERAEMRRAFEEANAFWRSLKNCSL